MHLELEKCRASSERSELKKRFENRASSLAFAPLLAESIEIRLGRRWIEWRILMGLLQQLILAYPLPLPLPPRTRTRTRRQLGRLNLRLLRRNYLHYYRDYELTPALPLPRPSLAQ